jgi:hypothetical protein
MILFPSRLRDQKADQEPKAKNKKDKDKLGRINVPEIKLEGRHPRILDEENRKQGDQDQNQNGFCFHESTSFAGESGFRTISSA